MPVQATMRKAGSGNAAAEAAKAVLAEAPAIDVTDTTFVEQITGVGGEPAQVTRIPTSEVERQVENPGAMVVAAPRHVQRAAEVGGGGSGLSGFNTDDIKFPVLKIVNGNGPLSQKFQGGTTILGDIEFLAPPPLDISKPNVVFPRFRFIPVELKKRYRENLDDAAYKAGQQPRIVDTPQEVEQLGGTYVWQGRIKPTWSPTATCFLLIEKPDNCDHPLFATEVNGKLYAPAVFYAGGSAFTDFAKTIISAAALSLQVVVSKEGEPFRKEPLVFKKVWKWETKKCLKGSNTVHCPVVQLTNEETTPEIRELCRTLKGSAAEHEGAE